MFTQISVPVARPEIVWEGLAPLIILSAGALLIVMFRSVIKQLPLRVTAQAVPAVGAASVVGMCLAYGLAGTDAVFAGVRGDIGDGVFVFGLAVAAAIGAAGARMLRVGLDAALTSAIGLTTLAATFGLWNDRLEVDGAFGALGNQYGIDGFSLVITGVIAASIVLVSLLLDDYLRREGIDGVEMYVLMLFSAAGGVVMAGANDLIVLFLGLETLSIAVYVMAAMHVRRSESQEAGLKYFVLGAFASAFLLYGIALVYGATGSTNLIEIRAFLAPVILIDNGLLMAGFAMLIVGFGFKVAAAPFHAWTPDVYQGEIGRASCRERV